MMKVYFSHIGWLQGYTVTRIEWPLWRDSDPAAWERWDRLLERIEREGFHPQMEAEDGSIVVWVKPAPAGDTAEIIVEGRGWAEYGTVCWPLQIAPDP